MASCLSRRKQLTSSNLVSSTSLRDERSKSLRLSAVVIPSLARDAQADGFGFNDRRCEASAFARTLRRDKPAWHASLHMLSLPSSFVSIRAIRGQHPLCFFR